MFPRNEAYARLGVALSYIERVGGVDLIVYKKTLQAEGVKLVGRRQMRDDLNVLVAFHSEIRVEGGMAEGTSYLETVSSSPATAEEENESSSPINEATASTISTGPTVVYLLLTEFPERHNTQP